MTNAIEKTTPAIQGDIIAKVNLESVTLDANSKDESVFLGYIQAIKHQGAERAKALQLGVNYIVNSVYRNPEAGTKRANLFIGAFEKHERRAALTFVMETFTPLAWTQGQFVYDAEKALLLGSLSDNATEEQRENATKNIREALAKPFAEHKQEVVASINAVSFVAKAMKLAEAKAKTYGNPNGFHAFQSAIKQEALKLAAQNPALFDDEALKDLGIERQELNQVILSITPQGDALN